jgi:hypothetical protein
MKGTIYVEDSSNAKISGNGSVDATYASILHTCPTTCALKGVGCYAQTSYVGMVNRRLQRRARGGSPLALARAEAKAIDKAYDGASVPAGRDLRLHVAGDSRTIKGTRLLASAVKRWKRRGGRDAWSYTHAHPHVPRKAWGSISVLASIESTTQVEAVRQQGYAPAIVVSEHPSDKAYTLPGSTTNFIPCPQQTRSVSCADCRLCMKADFLFATNRGIAFAAHGIHTKTLKRRLPLLQG